VKLRYRVPLAVGGYCVVKGGNSRRLVEDFINEIEMGKGERMWSGGNRVQRSMDASHGFLAVARNVRQAFWSKNTSGLYIVCPTASSRASHRALPSALKAACHVAWKIACHIPDSDAGNSPNSDAGNSPDSCLLCGRGP
jgi:hypothetical protein